MPPAILSIISRVAHLYAALWPNFTLPLTVSKSPLIHHVHGKVQKLSAEGERLLALGPARSEINKTVVRLDQEIASIVAQTLKGEALAELDRVVASGKGLISEIERLKDVLREGNQLRTAEITAHRAANEAEQRNAALAAAHETLNEFVLSIGEPALKDAISLESVVAQLQKILMEKVADLKNRQSLRQKGLDLIASTQSVIARCEAADTQIARDLAAWQNADKGLTRAQALRDQGNAIRNTVDRVRSAIIRREFNDRLNRVWRDLFIRLAPSEPFVPAFRIPVSSTHRLQPKLVTEHRGGGEAGGTPGAMLSAGNLNTAALTLFTALHLSVPKQLPWLILDDPVQSMDDVHIAHFAALLKTLSKEHQRQIVIAVHERQLFEYLKLELSPAFPNDSLLTLELSRGPKRDSLCIANRLSFKEEGSMFVAA